MKKRYNSIDSLRAIAIILMVVYHLLYDLVYIYHFDITFFGTNLESFFQLLISLTFISLSAFCVNISKRNYQRGVKLMLLNFIIMLVTMVFLPNNPIYYGILFCLGACIIIVNFLKKYLDKLNPYIGLALFLGLFFISYNIRDGFLNFLYTDFSLPTTWYSNKLIFLGLPPKGFHSSDYYPILPYLCYFIASFYLFKIIKKRKENLLYIKIPFFEKIGKHSLKIYLAHQVVLYLILFVILGV